eukprot:UC1_evm1s2054
MSAETVRVIVRCRPMNRREKGLNCEEAVQTYSDVGQIQLRKSEGDAPKKFTFDGVFGVDSNTKMIYEDFGFPLIESVLEGYNATVFAYGQTGCGKSFTMEGIPHPPEHRGITPRSFEHVFQEVAVQSNKRFLVRASYLEIYNENIRDLLGRNHAAKLDLKEHPEHGVYVKDLSEHVVHSAQELTKLMADGTRNRSTGATLMNADSSRSHSIFTVRVETSEEVEGDTRIRAAKLNLVDLAGSERQSKTGASGTRLKEATKINLSLSALGNVISALVDGKAKHIPYRDSKLTRLLQDSLGGNTKTLMVAAISPADNNYDETLSTLRYANRAKNIQNRAVINEDPKDAMLRQYQEEIEMLKQALLGNISLDPDTLARLTGGGGGGGGGTKRSTARRPPSAAQQQATEEAVAKAERVARQLEEERRVKAEEMAAMEQRLKREFDGQLASLQEAFEQQKMDNSKLEEEFGRVTAEFEERKEKTLTALKDQLDLAAIRAEQAGVEASRKEAELSSNRSDGDPGGVGVDGGAATGDSARRSRIEDIDGVEETSATTADVDGNSRSGSGFGLDAPISTATDSELTTVVVAVETSETPVVVQGPDGLPVAAVVGLATGQALVSELGPEGRLRPVVDEVGQVTELRGPTGRPARMMQTTSAAVPAVHAATVPRPLVVLGPQGTPVPALMGPDNVPVAVALGEYGTLEPAMDADTLEPIPLHGPGGDAAAPVIDRGVEPLFVVDHDGTPAVA